MTRPAHLNRRRRLLLWSAPVVLIVVLVIAKLVSMVIAGNAAADDFARGDTEALRGDVSTMEVFDVVDPGATSFAAGALATLEGRFDEAERRFAEAGGDCPALVNLALVREAWGDAFVGAGDGPAALVRYRAALDTVTGAPAGCFAGNDDANPERRTVREQAADRLANKIAILERPLAPPPLAAAPPPPPPAGAPPPGAGTSPDQTEDERLVLGPGAPLDRLRQLLEDGAAVRGAP